MSDDIRMGRKARKICTVMAAVFAVALMLAVPVLMAAESDAASFTAGDAGFCITAKDATDAELLKYGMATRDSALLDGTGTRMFTKLFNLTDYEFGTPTTSVESFTFKEYEGMKIEAERGEGYEGEEATFEKVKIEYTAVSAGDLLNDDYTYYGDDYVAAGNAIKEYFKNAVSAGDKITITGDIQFKAACKTNVDYATVNDTRNVIKSSTEINYYVIGTDVTIEFKHGEETKTISFYSNQKFEVDRDAEYDYKGKAYTDLTDGDRCNISYKDTYNFESGSSYYKVDGTEYKIDDSITPKAPDENVPVVFYTDSSMQFMLNELKSVIALCPVSAGNVTVDKTIAGVESAFSDMAAEVALDDILLIIGIIVAVVIGIIILVVVLIIVIVVLKKKKKNGQSKVQ